MAGDLDEKRQRRRRAPSTSPEWIQSASQADRWGACVNLAARDHDLVLIESRAPAANGPAAGGRTPPEA